ncbi:MAG: hypothetical protein U0172_12985 [Nitrospiraceae bacterium]
MKIKRKAPKPSSQDRPAFLVGWSFDAPSPTDLTFWFDLEYGGPLKLQPSTPSRMTASHALWNTSLVWPLSQAESEQWQSQLGWSHSQVSMVLHRSAPPAAMRDMQLLQSRLARGLTLLSEGTSYDVLTGTFWNPSDWRDRPLSTFDLHDHVTILHPDTEDVTSEWFRTAGLVKFGLDELEVARPRGLSSQPTVDCLLAIAEELLHNGQNPKVGSALSVQEAPSPVEVVGHRTIPHAMGPLAVRRVRWA